MTKKQILLQLMTLLLIATGANKAWASVAIVKDCDFEKGESIFTADSRITVSNVEAANGNHILQFSNASNSQNGYSFAHYDFSQGISSDVTKVFISFDFNLSNWNAQYNRYFTIGQSNQRTINNNSYSNTGAIFGFGLYRTSSTNYFSINGETTTLATNATNVLGTWAHADITVDITNKKVSYKIMNYDKTATYYSADNIDFWNTTVTTCNQIDFFDKANNATSQLDNLIITKHVTDGLYSYIVRSDAGKLIANGFGVDGSTVTYGFPHYINYNRTLYVRNKNNSGDYYRNTIYLDSNKDITLDYSATTTENVLFFTEAEDVLTTTTNGGNGSRSSYGASGYSDNDFFLTSLSAGVYNIRTACFANNSTTFVVKANGTEIHSQTGTGSWGESGVTEFALENKSEITVIGGNRNNGLDYIYIQAILAFKEPGATYTLGSGTQDISQRLLNGTGESVTYSSSNNGIVSVNSGGVLTLNKEGRAIISAKVTVNNVEYTAKYIVTVRATSNATGTFTYDATTHIEAFALSGTGNYDDEQKGGQRITFGVGNPNEVQYVDATKGLYCVDNNGYTWAFQMNGIPSMGSYYAFTPKYSGYLTIRGTATAQNGIRLVSEDGTLIEKIASSAVTANEEKDYTFTTKLEADQTYYVYAETQWMSGSDENVVSTLYLKSFSFDSTQSEEMTISVSDLLYPTVDGGINSANNRLDRSIPGFNLTFSGGDGATSYSSNSITFYQNASGVGQLDITPRLLSGATAGDIVFTGVTLNYNAIEAGKATSALINGQTATMAVGSTSADVTLNSASPTLTIRYGSDSDDNSFVLTSLTLKYAIFGQGGLDESLDRTRTATQLSFDQSEFYVSNGHPKGQPGLFVTPSTPQAYHNGDYFSGALSFNSADETIATVNSNGTVTMLATGYGSHTTISAQFLGTEYFLPSAVTSYTVISSVQLTGTNSYTIEHVKRGMVIEAVIGSDGTTVLDFASTIATSQQVTGADGQMIRTYAFDNNGSNNEFNVVISRVSGDDAYLYSARAYYKKPELRLNYTPQAVYNHHGNWTDATLQTRFANNQDVATCFDLEGEPTFTALFEDKGLETEFLGPDDNSTYSLTGNITFVTDPSTTPKATVRSTGSGSAITDATVSVPVSLRSTALGYDPTDANNVAVANLPVIPFPYTWNLTSGSFADKTKALELINVTDDGGSHVLLGPSSVAVHGIAIVAGRERPKTNYEIDPTKPNSRLRIPVMAGMKVSVTCYGAERRVTGSGYPLQISNVTDLRGYATATMEILTESNTQDFLAKDNGYVEIYNRSDVNVYIQRITVSAPELTFADGTTPKVSRTATYQNRVENIPTGATITFSDNDGSYAKIANRNNGTYTFQSWATGNVVVTATTGATAHALEPCWGQYTLTLVNFYFDPNTITLYHTQSAVSYHANVFLANVKLYMNGTEWSAMSDEEKAKISFSVAAPAYIDGDTSHPNFAKGIVTDQNNINDPYIMEILNDGQLIITAVYRDQAGAVSTVKTSCTVNIVQTSFSGFKYPAPTVAATATSYTFATDGSANPLDATTRGNVTSYRCTYIGKEASQYRQVTDLATATTLTLSASGVYHVEALNGTTPIAGFYLTKAYPVDINTSQTWDFRNGVSSEWGTSWSQPKNPTNGNNVDPGTVGAVPYFEYATWTWTRGMPTNRASDYRCVNAVNGNNGFIIKETSGLLVIADAPTCSRSIIDGAYCDGHFSAYTGDRYNYVYPNIGLHKATLIIPSLPKGAYVAVAWDRTTEGDGNTMVLENLLDLEGKTIDEIRYGGSVRLTGNNAGNQQGYYTFRVANDGNVTFTQNDKGTSRIVAIHVYYGNPDTSVDASDDVYYNLNATQEYKGSGMTQKLMAYARANADGTADVGSGLKQLDGILTTEGETTSQWLTNYLNFSAPNGIPEFKMVNQDVTLHNMTMDMSQTYFDSGNGTYAVPGLSFNGACWGKAIMSVGVRDGNGYLVAYRQYRFTVGIKPKMSYPKTWDFTRYFDNVTAKIEDSPVTVLAQTSNLNTKNSLAANTAYAKTTISVTNGVIDTDPTRTWDTNNSLMRSSGTEAYLQYGYNEYSSYYVDDAMLVCNLGRRNADGFILEETRGLGFSIAPESDTDTSKKLQWAMPSGTVGYGENCNLTLNGTITIAAIGEEYKGYYVFLRSSRPPDSYSDNLKVVNSGDYNGIVTNDGQYVYEVRSASDMTMTFSSDTEIYGIGVTNIKKDAVHPVGNIGWATESRDLDIDHTLTGYYTRHNIRAYEVKYDSYDLNTATVKLTEVKNTAVQTYDSNTSFIDHGYVAKGNGIVLAEFNVSETSAYKVPFFVPAITTTHEAVISNENMMHPNLVRRQFGSEEEGAGTRFFLTNIHWTFTKSGDLATEEQDAAKYVETDAAGFYRQHLWTASSAAENAAKNSMVPNAAYLLAPTSQLPVAVWNSPSSPSRMKNSIAIRFDDTTGIDGISGSHPSCLMPHTSEWYTLNGTRLEGKPSKAGLYIHNGRKEIIR